MRSTPEKVLEDASRIGQRDVQRNMAWRFLLQDDPSLRMLQRQCLYLSPSQRAEAVALFVDLHPENATAWSMQAPSYKSQLWAVHPRIEIVKDALWHYVLGKAQMNRAHAFAIYVFDDCPRLVLPLTSDLRAIAAAILSIQPMQSSGAFELGTLLSTMDQLHVHLDTLTSHSSSSTSITSSLDLHPSTSNSKCLVPHLRAIVFYGRSLQAPLAPPPNQLESQAYHFTIDVLAVQLPPQPPDKKKMKANKKKNTTPQQSQDSPDASAFHSEIKSTFSAIVTPSRGYFWSDNSEDALSLTAQMAVLLGNVSQRTSKQSLDALFGKIL